MSNPERIIELVLRFKTNGYQDDLDALMEYGQQIQEDINNDDLRERDDDDTVHTMEYLPEGSHWRDVTPVEGGWLVSFGVSTCLFISGAPLSPFHPSAADLPGGNELSPPQEKL